MKRFVVMFVVLMLVPSIGMAQDAGVSGKPLKLAKGTAEISSNFISSTFGVATMPSIGYFIMDNLEISGAFNYEDGEVEDLDYDVMSFSTMAIYHFDLDKANKNLQNLKPFAQAGFHIVEFEVEDWEVADSAGLLIGGGVKYFFDNKFSVNAILNFLTGDISYIRFGAGVSVYIF